MVNTILLASGEGTQTYQALFAIEPATFMFTLINTLIIVLMYRFFLHKPVMGILEKRQEAVNAEMSAALEAKENAEKTEKEYKALLSDSKSQADKIISSAVVKAQAREDEIIHEAQAAANLIRQKAEEDVERERKRAVNEIKNQIAELVVMAAGAVAEKEISEEDNAALIESFLASASSE